MKLFTKWFLVFRDVILDINKLLLRNKMLPWLTLFDQLYLVHLPSKVLKLPWYLNLVTCKTLSPSSHISGFSFPSFIHFMTFVFLLLIIIPHLSFRMKFNLWSVFYNSSSLLHNNSTMSQIFSCLFLVGMLSKMSVLLQFLYCFFLTWNF